MNPLFSVVIPNYNSFHLMERCIQSLEQQSLKDFEVIVVDDCSTDNSFEKLQQWAAHTAMQVTVTAQKKNAGPGAARNKGIDLAQGKYIIFIDADDFIEIDTMEQLLPFVKQEYDTIIFDAVMEKGENITSLSMMEKQHSEQGELSMKDAFVFVRGCTAGKAYRTDFLRTKACRFGEYYRSEDIPFTKSCVALSSKIYYLKKELYHYVEVADSIIHSQDGQWDETNQINTIKIIENNTKGLDLSLEIEAFSVRTIYRTYVFRMIHEKKPAKIIRQYIRTHFSKQIMRNPYISQLPKSRYIMLRIMATGCLPLIRLVYWYVFRRKT